MAPKPEQPWTSPGRIEGVPGHYDTPADLSRKAYAAVEGLTFNPANRAHWRTFNIGDEVQDVLPADVLAACLRNGDVTLEPPDVPERSR